VKLCGVFLKKLCHFGSAGEIPWRHSEGEGEYPEGISRDPVPAIGTSGVIFAHARVSVQIYPEQNITQERDT